MKIGKLTILTVLSFILIGCSIFSSSDDTEFIYPQSFDLDIVTIPQLLNEVEPPDSLNLNVYIVGIHECPEDAACFLPDRVDISEDLPPKDTLTITAINPSQFQINRRYELSVEVSTKKSTKQRDIHLLGSSLIN